MKEMAGWVMKKMAGAWILVLVFGIIIILSIAAIYFIHKVYNPQRETIGFEIQKALLQILTVLIFGQVISLVVAQFNFNRQKAEARIEFQRDILKRLIRSYIATKKHR